MEGKIQRGELENLIAEKKGRKSCWLVPGWWPVDLAYCSGGGAKISIPTAQAVEHLTRGSWALTSCDSSRVSMLSQQNFLTSTFYVQVPIFEQKMEKEKFEVG